MISRIIKPKGMISKRYPNAKAREAAGRKINARVKMMMIARMMSNSRKMELIRINQCCLEIRIIRSLSPNKLSRYVLAMMIHLDARNVPKNVGNCYIFSQLFVDYTRIGLDIKTSVVYQTTES
jgi:hypothetical protein